jgi:SAM-dependent methyltransferase
MVGIPNRESRRDTFLGNAEDYSAVRPEYPPDLLQAALEFGQIAPRASLLEIGCGTGEVTEWFARRGFQILALDRSSEMANLAIARLNALPNVEVRCQDFEQTALGSRFAGLIFATSYHWLDPNTRLSRCAQSLLPGGALIMLWHTHPLPYEGFFERIQPIYRRFMPGREPAYSPGMNEEKIRSIIQELEESHEFGSVRRLSQEWRRTYDRDSYLRLLNTYSDHRLLLEEQRAALFRSVANIIDQEYGGEVERPYRTELLISMRSNEAA